MIAKGMSGGEIVVAVDGSQHSLKALDWAVDAARAGGRQLVVVHVLSDETQLWRSRRDAVLGAPEQEPPDPVTDNARSHLFGREDLPEIRYETKWGELESVLQERGARGALLVLGSRGRGGFTSLLLGSTSRVVATKAAVPVVVVRDTPEDAAPDAPVLLGLNPTETADEVVAFAFGCAEEQGRPLVVLTAFPSPAAPLPMFGTPMAGLPEDDAAPLTREIERAQQERLAPYTGSFSSVRVTSEIGAGDAAGQLVSRSETAALLVVGRHRRRLQADSLMMGSVTNAVLHHAHCPVAVVPGTD
ncbi:universal stress protein [Streptomyces sp. NPDC048603]|uniref:universal stress protein n=1 Tax=Streptomyces sp. NPDC048603 TaxID=3365577 RepID=UPI003711E654